MLVNWLKIMVFSSSSRSSMFAKSSRIFLILAESGGRLDSDPANVLRRALSAKVAQSEQCEPVEDEGSLGNGLYIRTGNDSTRHDS
jgi:hypothetical protein